MFFQRTTALPCADGDLVSLRMSLNAPVVATDVAAPSPARAAIAVQRDALPRLCVSVAVRPLDGTGGALVFRPDTSSEDSETLTTLLEAALSFGESMGFLFDDDELEGADRDKRKRATARWNALLAGEAFSESKPVLPPSIPAPPGASSLDGDATIDLEAVTIDLETAAIALDAETAVPSQAPSDGAGTPTEIGSGVSPSLPLTKFRGVARAAAPATPAPAAGVATPAAEGGEAAPRAPDTARAPFARGRAPLARLQLVRRAHAADAAARPSWLQRLLASF